MVDLRHCYCFFTADCHSVIVVFIAFYLIDLPLISFYQIFLQIKNDAALYIFVLRHDKPELDMFLTR